MDDKVSYTDALDDLTEFWSQRTLATANGTLIKVAKGTGSTRWHAHDDQDETFVMVDGSLTVQLRDRDVVLGPGDLFVVERGIEHCPRTDTEARFIILGTSVTSNAAGGKPAWSEHGGTPEDRTTPGE
ncbi:cupin domain-containing protein [Curtobacterium sp. RRHDQ10]|uniref:cupin domain-containing protein n=1 Tax=Curtobacterium phyllosphaerae TaxID=3413379 RepID=UPI003BEFD7ED